MPAPLAKLDQIPPFVSSVGDYETLARERVSEASWAYLTAGAADEITARENCAAFARLRLRTSVLQDFSSAHTRVDLFGHTFAHPILIAPTAYQQLAHPDGELATVLAAGALQAGMVVSTQATFPIEDIARAAHGPLWFQLYIQPDRDFTRKLVARAEAAGYRALVVTADAPISGIRNREQAAGFALPPGIEAVNLRGMARLSHVQNGSSLLQSPLIASAATWNDIAWLRQLTSLPVLIKGIMTPEDAARAIDAGASGIIVSNHGGRVLDTQPATIDVLAEIADAVAERMPVLMDGGIRRGTDVFKALALGASAVMVGRPIIHGLAAAGPIGVAHVLRILLAEFEATMVLTGCPTLKDITRHAIR